MSATALALMLGISLGTLSALRRQSGFDYGTQAIGFFLLSVPTFVTALIFRIWGAIPVNDFISDPTIHWYWAFGLALVMGGIWSAIIGGNSTRRWLVFSISALVTGIALGSIIPTGWFSRPRLGYVGVAVLGLKVALGAVAVTSRRITWRDCRAPIFTVALGVALKFPLQWVFQPFAASWPLLLGLAIIATGSGLLIGMLLSGNDRRTTIRNTVVSALATGAFIVIDRLLAVWPYYLALPFVNHRPIPTFNMARPGIPSDFWFQTWDTLLHWSGPVLALCLASFAICAAYTRASLIDVLDSDYVRTARGKGLPEQVVVVRHSLRNALLPLTTIAPTDMAGLFIGALIIEPIFGIPGIGRQFRTMFVLTEHGWMVSVHPYMAIILLGGTLVVVTSLIVDLIYAILDPRIRIVN